MAIINLPTGYDVESFATKEAFSAHMKANILKGLDTQLGRVTFEDPMGTGEDQWVARMKVTKKVLQQVMDRINADTGCNEAVDAEVLDEVWEGCRD